ncbi:hypothetical protein PO909_017976 [Leuciscus waleckii]
MGNSYIIMDCCRIYYKLFMHAHYYYFFNSCALQGYQKVLPYIFSCLRNRFNRMCHNREEMTITTSVSCKLSEQGCTQNLIFKAFIVRKLV